MRSRPWAMVRSLAMSRARLSWPVGVERCEVSEAERVRPAGSALSRVATGCRGRAIFMTARSARAGSGAARAAAVSRLKVLGLTTLASVGVAVGDVGGVASTCCCADDVGGAGPAWSAIGCACAVAVGCAAGVWQ